MTSADLYDEIVLEFPALWPLSPEWTWVNVHDGVAPKVTEIADLIQRCIESPEVVVLVHSEPGMGIVLPKESAASYLSPYVLEHDVQVSDPAFERFVSIIKQGLATCDAKRLHAYRTDGT